MEDGEPSRWLLNRDSLSLGNFLRKLATPEPIKDWSLTSLQEKSIKIGARVVSHGRYVAFQMAEVAIPRQMFQEILRLIAELRSASATNARVNPIVMHSNKIVELRRPHQARRPRIFLHLPVCVIRSECSRKGC